jgi:hypothetical protein
MAEEPPKKSPKTALRSRAEKEKKKSPFCCFTANQFYVVNLKI